MFTNQTLTCRGDGKNCGRCGQFKLLNEYNKRARSADGKQSYCRDCNRRRSRKYYAENHERHIGVIRVYRKRRAAVVKARIDAIKAANGCVLCPENDPVCLAFHHLDPEKKDFELGHFRRKKWSVLLAEMRKCTVLCANCHLKVHAGKKSVDASMVCDPRRAQCEEVD